MKRKAIEIYIKRKMKRRTKYLKICKNGREKRSREKQKGDRKKEDSKKGILKKRKGDKLISTLPTIYVASFLLAYVLHL